MEKDKVSIVIPIYNSGKYLDMCLNSVVNQKYKNIEIILVNDGSTDYSEKICNKYLKLDNRIKYYFQPNQGASYARNKGIKEASGKYIAFLDSDDYIQDNYIERMICFFNPKIDLVCSSSITYKTIIKTQIISKIDFFESLCIVDNNIYKYNYQGYIWNKIFRLDIIKNNNILFDTEIFYNEDRLFVFEYLNKIMNDIQYLNEVLYFYQNREESAMNKPYNIKKRTEMNAFEKMLSESNNVILTNRIVHEMFFNSMNNYINSKDKYYLSYINLKNFRNVFINRKSKVQDLARVAKFYLKCIINKKV